MPPLGWKLRSLGVGMWISLYGLRVLVDPVAVDGLDLGACLLVAEALVR